MVGATAAAETYLRGVDRHIASVSARAALLPRRPRVYFEEWDEPMISAIRWVSELIEIAGGDDIFPERARSSLAKGRIIADPDEVLRAQPDVILGSWCGKRFNARRVMARPGWSAISAVRENRVWEIKSPIILQPGPAALTDGLSALCAAFESAQAPAA